MCLLCVRSLCALVQAAELSIKFLTAERAVEVVQVVGPRLAQLRKFNAVSKKREEETKARAHPKLLSCVLFVCAC